ncbi:hypothetical protein [Nocardia wallacei]|uniref:hypothetical protein n=1 Tax=Nocardia wallacei TaxID=480035 RepID=UPI00245475BE|nr:hypothetical protein [Nocardia wallacei]
MARKPGFRLNRRGVRQILRGDELLAKAMDAAAEDVADAAREELGDDVEITVTSYTTDRQAASVRVPVEHQARSGALTRAAAKVGLEVRPH